MDLWKSGILAATGAFAASAMVVAGAGAWIPDGFRQRPVDAHVAANWMQPASTLSLASKVGDENFWLSALAQPVSATPSTVGKNHRLMPGDRIALNGQSSGMQDLVVVDVKPLDGRLLPVADGAQGAPRLILVTCKTFGDADAALVRIVLEDLPANTPALTGPALTGPALTGAVQKSL
jgi:hypothetical protein